MGNWGTRLRGWARLKPARREPVIGVALGGGFARGIAHLGVLRVLAQHGVPVRMIAGVSAGSIVAAAYASGSEIAEIVRVARGMKFKDVARWSLSAMGLAGSERMEAFLRKLLKVHRFEEMQVPLAVIATNLNTGRPQIFKERGSVFLPIRASCSYPGLFQPVRWGEHYLVDGAMTMEVPAAALRQMGATHVISVCLPTERESFDPKNMFQVIGRSFQIMHSRTERDWRGQSSLVLEPDVRGMAWDCYDRAESLIESGEKAALAALPKIQAWLSAPKKRPAPQPQPLRAA